MRESKPATDARGLLLEGIELLETVRVKPEERSEFRSWCARARLVVASNDAAASGRGGA